MSWKSISKILLFAFGLDLITRFLIRAPPKLTTMPSDIPDHIKVKMVLYGKEYFE